MPDAPSEQHHRDLRLTFASGGWVLLVGGLLGLWLLLHLTWPLLTGKAQLQPDRATPEELGYDLSTCLIPKDQIVYGAPPGSIPPLVNPKTVKGSEAEALNKEYRRKYHHKFVVTGDRVIGVTINGESRAYQLKLLQWHEVCNDIVGGVPIAVTYSPLCDSVGVYDRSAGSDVLTLASSGFLYNSNSLLCDEVVGSTHGPDETLAAVDTGERWYKIQGCKQCHSLDGSAGAGPSFRDLYGSRVKLADGSSVLADEHYIHESVFQPKQRVVYGYKPIMPSFEGRLEDKSIASLTKFLAVQSSLTAQDERASLLAARDAARRQSAIKGESFLQQLYRAAPAEWSPQHSNLWTQLDGKAISGWAAGMQLRMLPCEVTHWGSWLARHPDTTLLSHDTGINRKYTQNAYGAYYDRMKLRFPVGDIPAGTESAPLFERCIAWQEDGKWVCRSYAEVKVAAGVETGVAPLVYEPFGAGMEPDSVRLTDPSVPVVYGLRFALEAFGYCAPDGL